MGEPLLQPGSHVELPSNAHVLSLDVRWSAGTQTAFAERLGVAALPLVRGRLESRAHLVFDNQPVTPDGSVRLGAHDGIVEVEMAAVPRDVERISVVVFVRPRPNAPRRTLDQLDFLSVSLRTDAAEEDIARSGTFHEMVGPAAAATVVDVVRERGGWSVVVQAKGHESGLDGAAAAAGIRL